MNKTDYSFLREPLNTFLREKLYEAEPIGTQEALSNYLLIRSGESITRYKQFLMELELSEKEFEEQYLKPWMQLDLQQIAQVMNYLNYSIGRRKSVVFRVEQQEAFRALHWTVIHIHYLGLKGLELLPLETDSEFKPGQKQDLLREIFGGQDEALPYQQCYFCGRVNQDTRGVPFGKKQLSLCHVKQCPTHDSNASAHLTGCCYKAYRGLKTNITRLLDKAQDEDGKIERFLRFCEDRFTQNLKIQSEVRSQKQDFKSWR